MDLELSFKKLLQKCKSKLNEITRCATAVGTTEQTEKITQNVTQSLLIKMQELSADYVGFKTR